MSRILSRLFSLTLLAYLGIFMPTPAATALSTRTFVLDDVDSLSAGELDGTSVGSDGVVTASVATRRHGFREWRWPTAWCERPTNRFLSAPVITARSTGCEARNCRYLPIPVNCWSPPWRLTARAGFSRNPA